MSKDIKKTETIKKYLLLDWDNTFRQSSKKGALIPQQIVEMVEYAHQRGDEVWIITARYLKDIVDKIQEF